jgi:hypothetical protein
MDVHIVLCSNVSFLTLHVVVSGSNAPCWKQTPAGTDSVGARKVRSCLSAVDCFAYTRPSSYNKAESKAEKSSIVTTIVANVRLESPLGGFVKNDLTTGFWWEVGKCSQLKMTASFVAPPRTPAHGDSTWAGDNVAREKVGFER